MTNALQWAKGSLPAPIAAFAEYLVDIADPATEGFDSQTIKLAALASGQAPLDEDQDFPACPYTWAKQIHPFNCAYAWPPHWDPRNPVVELDTPEYLGKIGDDKVVEMMLAKGGIRLAAILNAIFLDGA